MKTVATGLLAWLLQRVTALAMLLYMVFGLLHFLLDPPRSHQAWHAWMRQPGVAIATAVFFVTMLLHAWVGLRDVLMDYVGPPGVRVAALAALGFGLTGIAAWVARILLVAPG